MAISGDFDLAANPDPPAARKFTHHDPHHPRALVDTSEEWVLHNCSISLWSHTDTKTLQAAGAVQHALSRLPHHQGRRTGAFPEGPGVSDHHERGGPSVSHPRESVLGHPRRGARRARPAPQRPGRAAMDGHDPDSARRPGRLSIAVRGLRRDVGEPLPHPHARRSRDDAGGVGGRARRGRQCAAEGPRRLADDVGRGGERDLPAAVARSDVPAQLDGSWTRIPSSDRCFRASIWRSRNCRSRASRG